VSVLTAASDHPKKGQTPEDCRSMAESGQGAYSYDEFGEACWRVYGKEVKIQDDRDSIMEGFIIVNMNFSCQSSQPPVGNQRDLKGGFQDNNSPNKGNWGPLYRDAGGNTVYGGLV